MPSQEDVANQQELLAAYRRTLAQLLKQQALISELFTPPAIANGIDEARENIRRLKASLREWGVSVDDLPTDEALTIAPPPVPEMPVAPRARQRRSRRTLMVVGGLALAGVIGALAIVLMPRLRSQDGGLKTSLYWSQCDVSPVWILPGAISPSQDPGSASKQIAQAIAAKKVETWQVAGLDAAVFVSSQQHEHLRKLFMTVGGAGAGKINIHVFNRASITVATQPGPQHVDAVAIRTINLFDCPSGSGSGVNRTSPPIELLERVQQYTEDQQYTKDDFVTLDSETSESLVFPFVCQSPGVYTIQIGLRYRDNIRSEAGTYLSDTPATIVCPSSFTYWPVTYIPASDSTNKPTVQLGTPLPYHWDGKGYSQGAT